MKPAVYMFLLSLVSLDEALPMTESIGPYEIDFKKLDWCGNFDIKLFDTKEFTKLNKTTYLYSSNISIPYGFNDETEVEGNVAIMKGDKWVTMMNRTMTNLCSRGKKYFPKAMANALKAIGLTDCPVPAGNYTVRDFQMSTDFKVKVLPYNKYRLDSYFRHKGERYACIRMFVDVIPKADKSTIIIPSVG